MFTDETLCQDVGSSLEKNYEFFIFWQCGSLADLRANRIAYLTPAIIGEALTILITPWSPDGDARHWASPHLVQKRIVGPNDSFRSCCAPRSK